MTPDSSTPPPFDTGGATSTGSDRGVVRGGSISDADAAWFAQRFTDVVRNVLTVIRGKDSQVWLALVAMVAEGHILIEDVPGVGKTTLARVLASSIGGSVTRIQFTPDLLPSDVTGVSIWNQKSQTFEFKPGPVFTNICVGDEINRASPKTQSALLEVMEEGQVTVEGHPLPVPQPFIVIATQNPIELDGTYSLPEAQLDRFLIRMSMGYPDAAAESVIVADRRVHNRESVRPVASLEEVQRMVDIAARVHVAAEVVDYCVAIATATRHSPDVRLGSSPRGSLGLARAAQALAASEARTFVTPDDVKRLAIPVLAHRLLVAPDAALRGVTAQRIIEDALESVSTSSAV